MQTFNGFEASKLSGGLVKTHICEPHSRAYDSAGLRQGPRVCISCFSNQFSGDAAVAGLENLLREPVN